MNTNNAMKLETIYGEPVVLEGAEIKGVIHDLLSEVTIKQTYSNKEQQPIEAVYTFPMPIDAVLLNMTVQIGERALAGQIKPKKEAQERYEAAITDGDSAMMLQQVEGGMYTANVGNIGPGEKITLQMSYTTRHELNDGAVRFRLPTVIAPRYGDYANNGVEEHQIPTTSLAAENAFSFALEARGSLVSGAISSPSHKITSRKTETGIEINLANERADMDRDIIVLFKPDQPPVSCAWQGRDLEDQHAVMAFFTPVFQPAQRIARHIKLVLDCSGSMGGEKINRSRDAALAVLNDLQECDFFNITLFGSNYASAFPAMVTASQTNLHKARRVIQSMHANMGGTEMQAALEHAHRLSHPEGLPSDVLLVTDGEVTDHQAIIDSWRTRESRVFTVGIGNQVTEILLQELARTTQAACELVVLNEKIEATILRQFNRIGQPRIQRTDIVWPEDLQPESVSLPTAIFANDAFWINAQFKQVPGGKLAISLKLENGETFQQEAVIEPFETEKAESVSTVARLAASDRIHRTDNDAVIKSQAVAYQLMSSETNYIFVDIRTEKFDELPEVRKVDQMMPSGWDTAPCAGSINSFGMADLDDIDYVEVDGFEMQDSCSVPVSRSISRKSLSEPVEMFSDLHEYEIEIPEYLKQLSEHYKNPKDLLAAEQLTSITLPDDLLKFVLRFSRQKTSFQDAFIQSLIYLAKKYEDKLDKLTIRFYTKLAKQFKQTDDLQDELKFFFS